jgi:hypothetical protein
MNNDNGQSDDKAQAHAIRTLKDAFRKSFTGGVVLLTAGIIAMATERQTAVLAAVQAFDDFNEDNDPWGEHDMAALTVDGERIFFKIDYYDLTRAHHSDDPADPSKTERVLTIMLASEY